MPRAPRSDLWPFVVGLTLASTGVLVPLALGWLAHFGAVFAGPLGLILYALVLAGSAYAVTRWGGTDAALAVLFVALFAAIQLRHEALFPVYPATLLPAGEGYGRAAPGLVGLGLLHGAAGGLGWWAARPGGGRAGRPVPSAGLGAWTLTLLAVSVSAVLVFFLVDALPLGQEGQQAAFVAVVVIAASLSGIWWPGRRIGLAVPVFLFALLAHLALWVPAGVTAGAGPGWWVLVDLIIVLVVGSLVFTGLVLLRVFLGVRPPLAAPGQPPSER